MANAKQVLRHVPLFYMRRQMQHVIEISSDLTSCVGSISVLQDFTGKVLQLMYPKSTEERNKFSVTNMNVQQVRYCDVMSRVRPLYCFCKMAGLVPLYFTVNPAVKAEIIVTNVSSNIVCLIWSVIVFSIILAGFLYCVTILFSVSPKSPEDITAFLVSMPLSISLALMEIFMNQTVNRKNISDSLRS